LTVKIASLLSLSAAALATVALAATAWHWLHGSARFWIVNPWVERVLWIAVALAAAAGVSQLFSKWREFPRHRKYLISALLAALVAISISTLDFKSKAPAGQKHGRYTFSEDGTTPNAERWRSALSHLAGAPGVRALEIGTYEGRSAIWFLENILTHSSSSITCIDIFDGPYELTFDYNVAAFARRVRKIRAPSQLGLRNLEPWSYDFAYIDGSHAAKDVLLDAMLTWDLVKPGGIIIFDDYGWAGLNEKFTGEAFTPRIAIDAFLHVLEPYIEIVHKDYQVIVRKRMEFNR
jgi:predicted O-methyltransferase YrrM